MDFIADLEYIDDITTREEWAKGLRGDAEVAARFWLDNFVDSTDRISGWGHHNYCTECHSPLLFDIARPYDHICSNCGKNNQEQKHHDVWVAQYRGRLTSDMVRMALLYRLDGTVEYRDFIVETLGFYADHYDEFPVHGEWIAKGKLMWQALSESTVAISMLKALAVLGDAVSPKEWQKLHEKLFRPLSEFVMAEPERLPNIRLWIHSAVGSAAVLTGDQALLDRALNDEKAVRQLVDENVTDEGFWREGSAHYHFYALQGLTDFIHLAQVAETELPVTADVVRKMYITPIRLSYDNLTFPNPNDGWPDASLIRYVHQYELADKLFREDALAAVIDTVYEREPERRNIDTLLYGPTRRVDGGVERRSINLPDTNFALLRNSTTDVFMKYGFASRSHPHFDRMTIEIYGYSRDPSNIGYGSPLHGEWYRNTPAHNTVCVDGENQPSLTPGSCTEFVAAEDSVGVIEAEAEDVYPGVTYRRRLELDGNVLTDRFFAESGDEHTYDWFFHVEGALDRPAGGAPADNAGGADGPSVLGYSEHGYQHLSSVVEVDADTSFTFRTDAGTMTVRVNADPGSHVFTFLGIGNPATERWPGILVRSNGTTMQVEAIYEMTGLA